MHTYTATQVIFTILIWVLGIYLIVRARKLQKNKANKFKISIFYIIGVAIVLSMLSQILSYSK